MKKQNQNIVIVVYVDDIIVTRDDNEEIHFLKTHLDQVFTIKDLGILHNFLGIEVSCQEDGLILTQHKFTKELLTDSRIKEFKYVVTPFAS